MVQEERYICNKQLPSTNATKVQIYVAFGKNVSQKLFTFFTEMEKAKNSTDKTLSVKNQHTKYLQKMLKIMQKLTKITKIAQKGKNH